ncbi:MAG TPA: hypothetical protein VIM53_04980 [Candidatus Saccharimonadales bacterium]
MKQTPTPWLRVTAMELTDRELVFRFTDYLARTFSIRLDFDRPIQEPLQAYPKAVVARLLNYIALAQAMYLFNFDYYEEVIGWYELSADESQFFSKLYFAGLAEFRFTNDIPLATHVAFRGQHALAAAEGHSIPPKLDGALVGNGGGKDGATAGEIANTIFDNLTWFSFYKVGKRQEIIDASPFQTQISANRTVTPATNGQKYAGHKAVSADIALQAVLAAMVTRRKYVVVANEYSANEGNFVRDGVEVNHQYTKSLAYETDFASFIRNLGVGIEYFSVVRPLYELQILRIFKDFPAYHHIFISCNHNVRDAYWCLECAKCAFLVLAVTALDPAWAERVWGDKFVIAKPELREHLVALVSPALDKPFECVGTLEECQLAAGLILANEEFFAQLPADLQEIIQKHAPADFDTLYDRIMRTFDRANNIPDEIRPEVYKFFEQHVR